MLRRFVGELTRQKILVKQDILWHRFCKSSPSANKKEQSDNGCCKILVQVVGINILQNEILPSFPETETWLKCA